MKRALAAITTICLVWQADCTAQSLDGIHPGPDWPTHYLFADGTDVGLSLVYQYDVNRFTHGSGLFDDARTNRRKEVGLFLHKDGAYDVTVIYDFQARIWLDVFMRWEGRALTERDIGTFRIGYMKTPVGLEGNTATGFTSFLETSLPTQAIYAGRRIGGDWTLIRPSWLVQVGFFEGGNPQGDDNGRMVAIRGAWTPMNSQGNVLHLGASASHEVPKGRWDGADRYTPPSTRLQSLPEAGLTMLHLVDSGLLSHVDRVDRRGTEALWIRGAWSMQAEYLDARVGRREAQPYRARGWYAFGSVILTGESRVYADGNVRDVVPKGPWGAMELLIRYSTLDLTNDSIPGGRESDWTIGAAWHLSQHFKVAANYVRAWSSRGDVHIAPRVFEMRAQVEF